MLLKICSSQRMNMNNTKIDYPKNLDIIFDKLNRYNVKILLVGGYVRDYLLNIPSKDIDIELFNLSSYKILEEILQEFGEVNSVGKSFGVCKLKYGQLDLDFSLPRKDSKHSKGHKGFEISVDSSLDYKSAASRRDFTMNSIGYDVKAKKLLDPFGGVNDLHNSLIKAVDLEKLGQDPLRVLRAVQFSARFKFKLDEALFILCAKMINDKVLDELPKERIFSELAKLLLKSSHPSTGLYLAQELQIKEYFGEYLCLDEIDYLAKHKTKDDKKNIIIFLALLYSKESLKQIEKITNEVKLIKEVTLLIQQKELFTFTSKSDYELYLLATKIDIELLLNYLNATYLGTKQKELQTLKKRALKLNILNSRASALLQGRDIIRLGLSPSNKFKEILEDAYTMQIKGLFNSKDDALEWLQTRIAK